MKQNSNKKEARTMLNNLRTACKTQLSRVVLCDGIGIEHQGDRSVTGMRISALLRCLGRSSGSGRADESLRYQEILDHICCRPMSLGEESDGAILIYLRGTLRVFDMRARSDLGQPSS